MEMAGCGYGQLSQDTKTRFIGHIKTPGVLGFGLK